MRPPGNAERIASFDQRRTAAERVAARRLDGDDVPAKIGKYPASEEGLFAADQEDPIWREGKIGRHVAKSTIVV
jgi:hypothetical protein